MTKEEAEEFEKFMIRAIEVQESITNTVLKNKRIINMYNLK